MTAKTFVGLPDIRVGQGFDVHKFAPGDSITLAWACVSRMHSRSKGHSDADAPMHALTDAILGAIGEADIGFHFPPSDVAMAWRRFEYISRACQRSLVAARGGVIAHVDITILAEAPRIAPHIAAMKEKLGAILHLHPSRLGIKATTTETLGFVGRREGIAAFANATVGFQRADRCDDR